MTLQEFITEQKTRLEKFEKYWIEHNKMFPENFPLSINSDNDGLWYEQFMIFDEDYEDDELYDELYEEMESEDNIEISFFKEG